MSFISSSCHESPTISNRKSIEKGLRVSSKRKLLISPSKDLMIFFDNKTFTKLNPINANKDHKSHTKLTLDRKNNDLDNRTKQKKCLNQINQQQKTLSVTNSTKSFNYQKILESQNVQKKAKLKKQVDQIRRKYSYSKLGPQKELKKTNSTVLQRIPAEMSASQNSNRSVNSSKEKMYLLTQKNDQYVGRKILTKNVFSGKPASNLRLKQNLAKTLKQNNRQSQEMKRKDSFQFENMTSSVNLKSELSQGQGSKMFHFTFGSMALMDLQNRESQRLRSVIKI